MWPYICLLKREEISAVERLMGADSPLSNVYKPELFPSCAGDIDYRKANASRKLKRTVK